MPTPKQKRRRLTDHEKLMELLNSGTMVEVAQVVKTMFSIPVVSLSAFTLALVGMKNAGVEGLEGILMALVASIGIAAAVPAAGSLAAQSYSLAPLLGLGAAVTGLMGQVGAGQVAELERATGIPQRYMP